MSRWLFWCLRPRVAPTGHASARLPTWDLSGLRERGLREETRRAPLGTRKLHAWNFLHWKTLAKPLTTPAEFTFLVPIGGQQRHTQNDSHPTVWGLLCSPCLENLKGASFLPPTPTSPLPERRTQNNRRLGLWNLIFNCFKDYLGTPSLASPIPETVSLPGQLGQSGFVAQRNSHGVGRGEAPQMQEARIPSAAHLLVTLGKSLYSSVLVSLKLGGRALQLWEFMGRERNKESDIWNSWHRNPSPSFPIGADSNGREVEDIWGKRRVDGCTVGVF